MVDWNAVKCLECKSRVLCRSKSITKASPFCKGQRGFIPKLDMRHDNKSLNFVDTVTGFFKHKSPKQLFKIRKQQEKEEEEKK